MDWKSKIKNHLESASVTFLSAALVFVVGMADQIQGWESLSGEVLKGIIFGALFAGVRAVLREIKFQLKKPE